MVSKKATCHTHNLQAISHEGTQHSARDGLLFILMNCTNINRAPTGSISAPTLSSNSWPGNARHPMVFTLVCARWSLTVKSGC
jgi:hypothetical protein